MNKLRGSVQNLRSSTASSSMSGVWPSVSLREEIISKFGTKSTEHSKHQNTQNPLKKEKEEEEEKR